MKEQSPMQKLLLSLLIAIVLFVMLLVFGLKVNLSGNNLNLQSVFHPFAAEKELHGPYTILHIRDGDTIDVDLDGTETTLRFIGLDTPESVNPDESLNCEEGKIASQFTKDYLADQKAVWIEYDKELNDDYGRTLAYIYLDENGQTMYQDILLENGMAHCLRISPNTKYANHFAEIELLAKMNGKGFWEYDFWNE